MSECIGPGCPTCGKPEIPADLTRLREIVARAYARAESEAGE